MIKILIYVCSVLVFSAFALLPVLVPEEWSKAKRNTSK